MTLYVWAYRDYKRPLVFGTTPAEEEGRSVSSALHGAAVNFGGGSAEVLYFDLMEPEHAHHYDRDDFLYDGDNYVSEVITAWANVHKHTWSMKHYADYLYHEGLRYNFYAEQDYRKAVLDHAREVGFDVPEFSVEEW